MKDLHCSQSNNNRPAFYSENTASVLCLVIENKFQ